MPHSHDRGWPKAGNYLAALNSADLEKARLEARVAELESMLAIRAAPMQATVSAAALLQDLADAIDADIFTDADECQRAVNDARMAGHYARAWLRGVDRCNLNLWIASADADEGTQAEIFMSLRAAEDWIIGQLDDDASREGFEAHLAEADGNDIFSYIDEHRRDSLDTFNLDSRTIDLAGAMPRPRVVVALDGGLVQGASSNVPVDLCVVDYDVEGAGDDEVVALPQSGKVDTEEALLRGETVDVDPAWVDAVFALNLEALGEAVAAADLAQPDVGDVAEDGEEVTEATVGYLVRDALVLLDRVTDASVNDKRTALVTFTTDDGTAWRAAVSREV